LIRSLTDAQLELATAPPRARGDAPAATIERVLIGHCDTHRAGIMAKANQAQDAASAWRTLGADARRDLTGASLRQQS
jgi:hypothetical protein